MAQQPYMGLGPSFFWTFRNSIIFGVELLAPRPNPKAGDQGLHFVWPLLFDLPGMGGPTRSLRSRRHSSPGYWGAQTSSPRKGGSPSEGNTFPRRNIIVCVDNTVLP
jgi:hypothetical protein